MQRKPLYNTQKPYNQGGPKNTIQPQYSFFQFSDPAAAAYYQQQLERSDVGAFPGGGGGAGRVIGLNAQQQYTTVGAPPNSGQQVQQTQQSQQLRPQVPPLPPSHNPHNTGGGPQSLPPHSQHHPHHSAIAQHSQHHQVITTGGVGGAANLGASVQQVPSGVGPPGSNQAQQGNHHDLNAQGIPQVSSQQMQQVSGVSIIPTGGTHQMMYQSNNQNAQQQGPQQPTPQGTPQQHQQYFQHQTQQNAALLQQQHAGQHQRQVHTQHPQTMHVSYQNYIQANMIPQQLLHSSNGANIYQQFTMPQPRPGTTTTQYQQIPQATAGPNVYHNMNSYHQMQAPIYYQPQQQVKPQTVQAPPPQRERKIIAIIDPATNLNILDEIIPGTAVKKSQPDSPVQSRDSSEGNTPAPGATPPNKSVSNIQAQFALQVTQVATGVDKNKENAIDNVISTIESGVESHMDLSNDVRENVKLVSNSSVDSSSKDTDINKITRNVPDHNVSKVQQAHVTNYQPTPPLVTAAVAQQGGPVSAPQSQRQNKQARGAVPVVAPIPTQPQAGAQQQPQQQPPKTGGNQQQTKQPSPPQPSKQSNLQQPKSSGNQTTSKGSPSSSQHGTQHSKSHAGPVQKSSQHQQPSKQQAPQQAKVTTEAVSSQSGIQVEQQQLQSKTPNEQQPLSRAATQATALPHHPQVPVVPPQVSPSPIVHSHVTDSPQIQIAPDPEVPTSQKIVVPIEEKVPPRVVAVMEAAPPPLVKSVPEFVPTKRVQVDMAPKYMDSQISVQSASKAIPTQQKVSSQPDQSLVKEVSSLNGTQTSIAAQVPLSRLPGDQPSQQAGAPIKPMEKTYPVHKEPPTTVEPKDVLPVTLERNDSLNLQSGKRGKEKLANDLTQEQMDSKCNDTKEELPSKINATIGDLPITPEVPIVQPSPEKSDIIVPPSKPASKVGISSFEAISNVTFQTSQFPKSDIEFSSTTPVSNLTKEDHLVPKSLVRNVEQNQIREPMVNEHPPRLTNNIEESKITENHDFGSVKKVNNNKYPKKIMNSDQSGEPNIIESVPNQISSPVVEVPPILDSGKRQYGRDFLLQLQQNPLSLMRPDSLPNLEVVLDGPHQRSYEHKPVKMMQDFTPSFLQSANRNRGGPPTNYKQQMSMGRNSQQGRRPQKIIDIKLSSSSEVKLKTTENAWKPSTKESKVKEERPEGTSTKHEELMKRVRGILNKLTPDNFEKLVVRVKSLPIESYFDLEGIIGLIFEKAVDEQSFSSTYAMLCQVLSTMTVKYEDGSGKEAKEGKDSAREARFRNLIINRCQKEFEKDNSKDQKFMEITKQLESATTNEQRLELNALIDYEETKLRKRSVGNIRFIGELYKLKMLTSPIMMRIIEGLLKKKDEESLECLCKLLTTIGKNLETSAKSSVQAQEDFNCRFQDMQNIIEDKNSTSSRVRFFVMDVIDLRKNNWIPRREDIKPKTKSEIHADIKKEEEINQQQLHLISSTPRNRDRDDRDRDRKKSRDNRNNMQEDGGWNMVGSTANSRRIPLDGKRLQMTPFSHDTNKIELRTGFSSWARGSSGGSGGLKEQEEEPKPNNRFAILDSQNLMGDNRRNTQTGMGGPRLGPGGGNYHRQNNYGSKSMPPPLPEKEHSISSIRTYAPPGDRSKSNSRSSSRDNSISREIPSRTLAKEYADYEASFKFSKGIIEEFVSNKDVKEAMICVDERFHPSQVAWFVQATLEYATDRDSEKRSLVGRLFHDLMVNKKLTLTQFLEGSKSVIEMTEDLRLDIPQVCGNLGEILAPLLLDGAISVGDLLKIVEPAVPKPEPDDLPPIGDRLDVQIFAKTLFSASKLLGPSRVQTMWMESKLTWEELLNGADVEEFLEKHGIGFTIKTDGGIITPEEKIIPPVEGRSQIEKSSVPIPFNSSKIRKQLFDIFKRDASNEEIFGWIEANVGSYSSTPAFARALTQALVESQMEISTDGSHLIPGPNYQNKLKNKAKLITKYVDNNDKLEIACIFGIQQVSVENQHPAGFMEQSFNAFYDQDVLSDDAFQEWAKNEDPEEQLGKGVCLTSVRKFLSWLNESETDDAQNTDQPKLQITDESNPQIEDQSNHQITDQSKPQDPTK